MAFGPAMARGGVKRGCCWLGTAILWPAVGRDRVSAAPQGSQHPGPPRSTVSSMSLEGTVACLLAEGCASAAKGFSQRVFPLPESARLPRLGGEQ